MGEVYERENWGLAAVADLNNHPDRNLPRLDSTTPLDSVHFRVEFQGFRALPASAGIFFVIQLVVYPLRELLRDPEMRANFTRMLATMPPDIAEYMEIAAGRENLVKQLGDWKSGCPEGKGSTNGECTNS